MLPVTAWQSARFQRNLAVPLLRGLEYVVALVGLLVIYAIARGICGAARFARFRRMWVPRIIAHVEKSALM